MAKVRPEEGHVWQRKMGATVSARMSRRLAGQGADAELAIGEGVTAGETELDDKAAA